MSSYRLDELAQLCGELGLEAQRVDPNRLEVQLFAGCVLAFCNLVKEDDTLVGFDGTPWHAHGAVLFNTGGATYTECDELDILVGLGSGELLIVSRFLNGELADRWVAHKDEPLDVKYVEPGEELRAYRLTASEPR